MLAQTPEPDDRIAREGRERERYAPERIGRGVEQRGRLGRSASGSPFRRGRKQDVAAAGDAADSGSCRE
ncbi:MAG: hypothetical protein IT438_10645 [Phycisphaerales bacterium]|nr:hypothetical protein [Phycisphaerales bacterium]